MLSPHHHRGQTNPTQKFKYCCGSVFFSSLDDNLRFNKARNGHDLENWMKTRIYSPIYSALIIKMIYKFLMTDPNTEYSDYKQYWKERPCPQQHNSAIIVLFGSNFQFPDRFNWPLSLWTSVEWMVTLFVGFTGSFRAWETSNSTPCIPASYLADRYKEMYLSLHI